MPYPCDCCRVGEEQCALAEHLFDGGDAVLVSQGTATGVYPLNRWSDGDTAGPNFTGFNSPGVQFTAATSPVVDLLFAAPQNRVRGLREWNQGGGDLGDADGFASWDAEFFAGAASLGTFNMTMGNGGAPFTMLFPGLQELNGVTRVRLSNMRKLNPGSGVSPLTREVRSLSHQTVYPCRRPNGTVEWYNENGLLVPTADVTTCDGLTADGVQPVPPAAQPVQVTQLRLTEQALGDDASASGERLCNVSPAVSAFTGFTQVAGPCYDGNNNAGTLTWNGPVGSVTMTYESGGNPGAGAALLRFQSAETGTITWPANATPMTVGEVRRSNIAGGDIYATITYLATAGSPASGAPRLDGGNNIRVGPSAIQAFAPYRFRIDFWR